MEHNVDWEQRIDFDKLRKERLNHLKEGMVQHGLDAILSFSTDHIRYITCFRPLYWSIPTHSLTRQAAIFVPGKDPVLFVTGPDYPRAHSTMNWGETFMGGTWGAEFTGTGLSGIIIYGRAKKPVYLYVKNDGIQIKDAAQVWGKDTFETNDILQRVTDEQ